MLRELRQLEKIVGRRDAIRYGGLGMLSLALAACGGKNKSGTSDPKNKPSKATVTGAAVEAFARGTWNLSITPKGKVHDEYARIDITGRTWSLGGGDLTGSFTLTGDEMQVEVDQRDSDNVWAATGMPGTVGDKASLTLQWRQDETAGVSDPGPVDTTPFPLPVSWDGTTLKIQAKDGVLITAVRA